MRSESNVGVLTIIAEAVTHMKTLSITLNPFAHSWSENIRVCPRPYSAWIAWIEMDFARWNGVFCHSLLDLMLHCYSHANTRAYRTIISGSRSTIRFSLAKALKIERTSRIWSLSKVGRRENGNRDLWNSERSKKHCNKNNITDCCKSPTLPSTCFVIYMTGKCENNAIWPITIIIS